MFLGDPESIEVHLNNDWTILLKNLKNRQDYHLQMLTYNHRIVSKVRDQNSQLFVSDEIQQHHKKFNQIASYIQQIDIEQKEIYEKYQELLMREDGVVKLMTRVGARILEICQSSIDKCKVYDETLIEKHMKMRRTLIEHLNQKDGVRLDTIIKCVTTYSKEKLTVQTEKLKKLILALQNGEYFKLNQVYLPKEKKTARSVERKIDILKDLSKAKAEKDCLKTEQKQVQKFRKQKQKTMNNLYNAMELSKQQFIDDGLPLQEKNQRLFNQISLRNKFNYEQIKQFSSKQSLFEQKIRLFTENLQKQSRKAPEVIVRKPVKKEKSQVVPQQFVDGQKMSGQSCIKKLTEIQNGIEIVMTEGSIDSRHMRSDKKIMNTIQFKLKSVSAKKQVNDLPNLFTNFMNTQENFSHFKFDVSNRDIYSRTNKHILPDISKGTSLDQRTQVTKIKIDKILRTTIRTDEKMNEQNSRKYQNSRKTAIINRQQAKNIEDNNKFRVNFKNIDFGSEGFVKRNILQRQKFKNQTMNQQISLFVKKAELKPYEPKLNIIF